MNRDKILAAAKAAAPKVRLEEHREAVQELRDKGFTWREIADFLTEQGVPTDHTRVYRTFGKTPKTRRKESRHIEISRIKYVGERKTKKNNFWNVMELELPSKLGAMTVVGYAWGTGTAKLAVGDDSSISCRDATLVVKTGDGFPTASIQAEFQREGDFWAAQEVYIMPKWESLIEEMADESKA